MQEEILHRIERLERSARRSRLIAIATVLIAGAVGVMGFGADKPAKVLRAERFEVVHNGRTVAALGQRDLGGALTLFSRAGKPGLELRNPALGDTTYWGGVMLSYDASGDLLAAYGGQF